MKKVFRIEFSNYVELELDSAVIESVDDEFRHYFYNLYTPEDIARHIAYNLIAGYRLSDQEAFGQFPDSYARFLQDPLDDLDFYVQEVTDKYD